MPIRQIFDAFRTSAAVLLFAASCGGASASSWTIDPARTHIGFVIDAVGFPRTKGVFHKFSGKISIDFEHPQTSRVAFTVETASIDVGSAGFDETLRGPAFLDAARRPEIRFASTSVEKIDDHTALVNGDLTLLGVTRPLQVRVQVVRLADRRLGFVARAVIDRTAFGMNSGFPVISRDVDLVVSSEAVEP